jgi:hypothetical protein
MEFELGTTIALLERTPGALDALLRGLPEAWTLANEGGESWSAFYVVGHLVHCERTDWMVRVRAILESDGVRELPPFDRFGHVALCAGSSLDELLDALAAERRAGLAELRGMGLTDSLLAKRGVHPIFGEVTLKNLLATWAVHDMTHLHQISRVLGGQYREAVGLWEQYLSVLARRPG